MLQGLGGVPDMGTQTTAGQAAIPKQPAQQAGPDKNAFWKILFDIIASGRPRRVNEPVEPETQFESVTIESTPAPLPGLGGR